MFRTVPFVLKCGSCRIEFVRWATKPRWVPIAKSKEFRVPKRIKLEEFEAAEIVRLNLHHRTYVKALHKYLKQNYRENETSAEVLSRIKEENDSAWQLCLQKNQEWNEKIAIERQKRDEEEFEKIKEEAVAKMKKVDEENRIKAEELEALIAREKEASKSFITKDNVDEVIEKVLSSPTYTFNYAIDRAGNIYPGFDQTPLSDLPSEPVSESKVEAENMR